MLTKHALIALGLGIAMSALSVPAMGQDDTNVVAEINGHKVTADELDQKEGSKLLQAKYKYYLSERDALEQYIDNQLLEMQAKKEGVTLDELFKRHVESKVPQPTEDELRFYFEGVQTEDTYETARPNIISTVHQIRAKKAQKAYIEELRAQYGVVVELSQPSAQAEVAGAPRLGSENAPVQVVEFADYECPYCQKVNDDLKKLREQFGDQVSLVYKDFPLPMHQFAQRAAEAARCAGEQGKFWEYHDALFENKKLHTTELKQEARALKLDGDRFDKCLDSGAQTAVVKKDGDEALKLGLSGTPSFFINNHFMTGSIGYDKLRETVTLTLAQANSAKKQSSALLVPAKDGVEKK